MSLYIGIDVGTQSCKAVVWDSRKARVVSQGQHAYDILPTTVAGRAEQNPHTWTEATTAAIQSALRSVDRSRVAAMAVSGQQHGLVALDGAGAVIRNAKLWCDVEAAPQAEALSEALGWTVVPGFTAPKIMWLRDNEPTNWERLRHVLLPHDYINYWLTGNMAMECGDASGTGLFDVHNRCHDTAAMATIDPSLPAAFPPLIGPSESVGTLRAALAEQLGLPAGVVVGPGSGDNMMSALGAGAVSDGDLVLSLGTSGTLFSPCSRPVFDPSGAIAPFCDATGQWLPLLCTMNCTGPPEEVRKAFDMDFDAITQLAARGEPGASGVNFLPYLAGERTPQWPHASGAVLGLRPGSLSPGNLYRAALEGSTFSLQAGVGLLRDLGVEIREARVVGGGSKNALWRRIIADALQLPLRFPTQPESAALGAALQAAAVYEGADVASFVRAHMPDMEPGVLEPDEALRDVYGEAYARHQDLGGTLFARGESAQQGGCGV